MIFLNRGGSISLLRKYSNASQTCTVYVIDSHRSINLEILDSRIESAEIFDDSQSVADLLFELPDSDADDEHFIITTGTRKSRSFARLVHKQINPMNNEMNQYIKSL